MHNEMIAKVPLHGGFVGYASRQQRRELKEKKKRAIGHWRPISISVAAYRIPREGEAGIWIRTDVGLFQGVLHGDGGMYREQAGAEIIEGSRIQAARDQLGRSSVWNGSQML